MPRRAASRLPAQLIQFGDFDWFDERTKVAVTVHGNEVQNLFQALAKCNGVPVKTLLENSKIEAGMPLQCCEVHHLPQEWSWQLDYAGYLLVKLRQSFVPRGHSFAGNGDQADDSDYVQPKRRKRSGPTTSSCEPSTPQRAQRAARPREASKVRVESSPGSPQDVVGCTQPVQIRLHRLAFLASCGDLEATSGLQIRHICGNKACAMVSHFRAGTTTANSADREYHKSRKGRSRESFPPLQQ